jgi:hypothetical protein
MFHLRNRPDLQKCRQRFAGRIEDIFVEITRKKSEKGNRYWKSARS